MVRVVEDESTFDRTGGVAQDVVNNRNNNRMNDEDVLLCLLLHDKLSGKRPPPAPKSLRFLFILLHGFGV
jgi:hypothetical protein